MQFVPHGSWKIVLALTVLLVANGLQADPLSAWTWRSPYPQGSTLSAACYGGGQFVAVGDNGAIITSQDGYNWTNQSFGIFPYLRGVAYANGEYVAVGDGGVILISSNGANWTQMPTVTTNSLHGVAGNSAWQSNGLPQFVAVGDSGTVLTCTNGTNWSARFSPTTNSLYGVTTNSAGFLVVGNAGTVVRFTTGGFSLRPFSTVGTTNNLYAVAHTTKGIEAAVGDLNINPFADTTYNTNEILFSTTSGLGWTNEQWVTGGNGNPGLWYPSSFFVLHGVAYGTNGFVAVGDTGYSLEYNHAGVVFTSASGTNWSELPYLTSENDLYGCTYGNGLYVLVGDADAIVVSSNLLNWTNITGSHRSAIWAISCNETLCIAAAQPLSGHAGYFPDFTTLVSTNGVSWSVSTTNLPSLIDLTCGGTQFVGVSQNQVFTTTDGYNWNYGPHVGYGSFVESMLGVRYLNGQFIAVGVNGVIYTSLDGTNWNNCSVTTSGSLSGVAFGNGIYVAAGSAIATSADGVTWSVCPTNPPFAITRMVYQKGLFVAAANQGPLNAPGSGLYNPGSGAILTSPDGTNWQSQFTSPAGFTGIDYSGGIFVAITMDGTTFKSPDGTNWINTTYTLPAVDGFVYGYYYGTESMGYATVCAYRGTFLAAGLDGILMQSGNTWSPTLINSVQTGSNSVLSYTQQIDVPYHIQVSTNLSNWENLFSGVGTGQPTNYLDYTSPNYQARFYRIVSP